MYLDCDDLSRRAAKTSIQVAFRPRRESRELSLYNAKKLIQSRPALKSSDRRYATISPLRGEEKTTLPSPGVPPPAISFHPLRGEENNRQPFQGPQAHTALGLVSLIVNDWNMPCAICIESEAWPVFVFVKKLMLIRRSVLKSCSVSTFPLIVNVPVPRSVVLPPLHCMNR